ncbi:DNA-binding protein [Nocardia flavorosea]|uniref:DNA-binding protein n=1 Tax=Nocardia flavorosea TaxID=53429 RepID=UPI001C3F854E|nr:DNA-binding protein [Nocardia flavorosea]
MSKLYQGDRATTIRIEAARQEGIRVGTTAMTRLEAEYDRVHPARIRWVLSRIDVHGVGRAVSDAAAELLRSNTLSGHKYAIDAALAAVARAAEPPVTILTSDPEDLTMLCGPRIKIVKV